MAEWREWRNGRKNGRMAEMAEMAMYVLFTVHTDDNNDDTDEDDDTLIFYSIDLPSSVHDGYRDMESMKATRASRHSRTSLLPNLQETKNRQSVLQMIAATNNWIDGVAGIG